MTEQEAKKKCSKCQAEKLLEQFHINRGAIDGHHNVCKECRNLIEKQRRSENLDKYRETYRTYRVTHQENRRECMQRYKKNNPVKTRARRALLYAITKGSITKEPCEICGEMQSQGHHDDYSKPLDVRWLCRIHHLEAHNGRLQP